MTTQETLSQRARVVVAGERDRLPPRDESFYRAWQYWSQRSGRRLTFVASRLRAAGKIRCGSGSPSAARPRRPAW
ncbi:hypothetical protein FJ418_08210 [Mesorhizobium sp. B2-8-3]|nr:hypothetical protein FJ418_08210 [Mesorhizobium sp. B2-8-3]